MGKLPEAPGEVRLAALLFLLLLGIANLFGAWEVKNFAAFTPQGVARSVAPERHHPMAMDCCSTTAVGEVPVNPASLDAPSHRIGAELLVQDTHVHVPVYAMTAALLALVVFGLRFSSRARMGLVLLLFAAPFADFAGLWGAHLLPTAGAFFGAVAIGGGAAMGLGYLIVLAIAVKQLWLQHEVRK